MLVHIRIHWHLCLHTQRKYVARQTPCGWTAYAFSQTRRYDKNTRIQTLGRAHTLTHNHPHTCIGVCIHEQLIRICQTTKFSIPIFFVFFFLGTTTESENRERIVAIGVATVDRRMMGTVLLCALQRDGLCHWKEFRDSFRMLLVVI